MRDPGACSATSSETEDIAGNTVRVITADDTTRLGPDRRLLLDLMLGSYRIDVAAGPVDLTYIDVVGSDGLVRPIEEVVTAHVSSGRVTLEGLLEGFLITETENDIVFVLNGIELVDEPSGTHSTWWRSPTARCSGNNKLFGLGSSQPSNGSILFRGLIPINAYDVLAFSAQSAAQKAATNH